MSREAPTRSEAHDSMTATSNWSTAILEELIVVCSLVAMLLAGLLAAHRA